jgi:hypothetical protein
MASEAGNAAEVAMASAARARISHSSVGASDARAETTPAATSPMRNIRRGPKRSTRRPMNGWATAPTA